MSPLLVQLRQTLSRGPLPAALPGVLALLALSIGMALASVGAAGTLTAGGDHSAEEHAGEEHSGESLARIDLEGADLTESDLSGSDLKNANLVDATLEGADLSETDLQNADLSGTDLRDALLEDAFAKNASFAGALLNGASLVGASLKNADLSGSMLLGADLSDLGDIKNATFDDSYYDADTLLDPRIDTSGMIAVMGPCPGEPDAMLVMGDDGLACESAEMLPEPSTAMALACGGALLLALARRRR